jgi:hypothetical protein
VHPENKDIFTEEMGLDLMVFKGIIERTKACKIRVLDLRGFKLSKGKFQLAAYVVYRVIISI